LLVDTSLAYPVALDSQGWTKAGVNSKSFTGINGSTTLTQGVLPNLQLGAFPIPQVPGVAGVPMAEVEKGLEMNIDGMLGAGLLASFRVTLVDGGRTMWLEAFPSATETSAAPSGPPSAPAGSAPASPETPQQAPKPSAPPKAAGPSKPPAKPGAASSPK
jgi:hypothetical protein